MEGKYHKSAISGLDGSHFQINLITLVFLKAFDKLRMWKLSTNNVDASKFDDVVLEVPDGSTILLQAKYKTNRKITKEQLLNTNPNQADFSLAKYFFSYCEVETKFKPQNVIICTNTDVSRKGLEEVISRQTVDRNCILHYGEDSYSFITFNENMLPRLKENVKEFYKNNLKHRSSDKAVISDENLKHFLNKLQIFPNYPSGAQFNEIIEQLLFRLAKSHLIGRISSQDLIRKVETWWRKEKGEYLTESRAKAIFSEIRSDNYRKFLESFHVFFERNDVDFEKSSKIFHVNIKEGYLLQTLKIFRALQMNASNMLYIDPDDNTELQKQVLDAFAQPQYVFLIIILKPNDFLMTYIRDKLDMHDYKKIILITDRNNILLLREMGLRHTDICDIDGSVTFEDLSSDTRESIMKVKNIIFQKEAISLEELLGQHKTEFYKISINSALEKLLKGGQIKVGHHTFCLDEHSVQYYINRTFKKEIDGIDDKEALIPEELIYDVNEKVILISASAGMGKTTSLKKLATTIKQKDPSLWVITIALNEYTQILRDVQEKGKSINIMELLNFGNPMNEIECIAFGLTSKVVLMLDGVDEVSPDYTETILTLLEKCRNASNFAKIFITTRPHMVKELQSVLATKLFVLLPLTEQNQINFLTEYWAYKMKLKYEMYATAPNLTQLFHNKSNNFTDRPLHIQVLADVFQSDEFADWEGHKYFSKGAEGEVKVPKTINMKLCDKFLAMKKSIFVAKGNPTGTTIGDEILDEVFNEILDCHGNLALEEILDKEKCNLFLCYQQKCIYSESMLVKIGILEKLDGKLCFINTMIMEYFVANSIVKELKLPNTNLGFQTFFIEEVLSNPKFVIIRNFIDCFLQNSDIPSKQFEEYESCRSINYNSCNIIHLLAKEDLLEIFKFILKCIPLEINRNKDKFFRKRIFGSNVKVINIRDEMWKTPLHCAAEEGHFEMAKFLIEEGALIDVKDIYGRTPLHLAVMHDNLEMVELFVNFGANINSEVALDHEKLFYYVSDPKFTESLLENVVDIEEINKVPALMKHLIAVNIGKYEGLTALGIAFERNHENIIKYLQSVTVTEDIEIKEPLPVPIKSGNLDEVKLLLKQGINLNLKYNRGCTVLHIAVQNGNMDAVRLLMLETGVDLNVKNDEDCTALHLAVKWGYVDIMEILLENGADPNVTNNQSCTALHFAVKRGNVDAMKILLENGADPNVTNYEGCTALHFSFKTWDLEKAKLLLKHGADVNVLNKEGWSVLHFAVKWGNLDAVKLILENGVMVNVMNNEGCTPLHFAVKWWNLDKLKLLLNFGADMTVINNKGWSALHFAVRWGNLDVVKFVLEHGADVNVINNEGCTALYYAAKLGNLEVVTLLLENGVDVNVINNDGCTALHAAAEDGNHHIVSLLLENSADVNITNNDGHRALDLADEMSNIEAAKVLRESKMKYINIRDSEGRTKLHLAAMTGDLDTIKLLVKDGIDANITDNDGNTALHVACDKGQLDAVKCFADLKVDINIRDAYGNTALHCAAECGKLDTVKSLLQNGADVGVRDSAGRTALHLAARWGNLDIIKALVDSRIGVNIRDVDGRTALHYAAEWYRLETVRLLVEKGVHPGIRDHNNDSALHVAIKWGHLDISKFLAKSCVNVNDRQMALDVAIECDEYDFIDFFEGKV